VSSDVEQRLERLESLVEQQQETIERQQATIETQRERIDDLESDGAGAATDADPDDDRSLFSRRSLLTAAATVGLGGYTTGAASAAEPRGVIGTDNHPVRRLYLDTLGGPLTEGVTVSALTGDGLTVEDEKLTADGATVADSGETIAEDADRLNLRFNLTAQREDGEVQVFAEDTNSNTQTAVSDDGSQVVSDSSDIDFGSSLDVTGDGGGSVTVDADVTGATRWEEAGGGLLTTVASYIGVDVSDVQTDSLAGGVTGGTDLTSLTGNGLVLAGGALGIAGGGVGSTELANDSVTVAGNTVSLGSSTGVNYVDLGDTGSSFPIPNGDLSNSSVTVTAGNGLKNGGTVSLGGATTVDVEPADFAGTFLSDDGSDALTVDLADGLEGDGAGNVRVDGSAVAGNALSAGATPSVVEVNVGNALETDGANRLGVTSGGIGTDELDLTVAPMWAGTHTWDTGAGADLLVDESGIYYATGNAETLDLRNAGSGSLTLQEDGTAVVKDSRFPLPNADLSNSSVTVAGNSVSLGGSNSIAHSDLTGIGTDNHHAKDHDHTEAGISTVPNSGLTNSSVTVTAGSGLENGGSVSLGSSTTLDVRPADFAGTLLSVGGSDNLQVDEASISHDNIDQTTVGASDHHTRPSAGSGLTENSGDFDINTGSTTTVSSGSLEVASGGIGSTEIATDAVTGAEIDLVTIAGNNISVDSTNNELDGKTPAMEEKDSDGLLEPTDSTSIDGIDVTTVRTADLNDPGGTTHLTLNGGGPLSLNRTLDTNGNGIQSTTSVSVDIDADGGGTGETFTVSRSGGSTTLFTVNQGGTVAVNSGDLDVGSSDITNASGIDGSVASSKVTQLDGAGLSVDSGSLGQRYVGVHAYLGTTQGNLDTSFTTVEFDTETFDPGGNFNTATYEFVAPQKGYYSIDAHLSVFRDMADPYRAAILKNGNEVPGTQVECLDTEQNATLGSTLFLSQDDAVTVAVKLDNSTGNDEIRSDSNLSVDFVGR
jgi:fibronectin-binding autotransporter adhesin